MRKYVSDFKREEGGYQYTGDWYASLWPLDKLKKFSLILMAELLAITVLFVGALFLNNTGSHFFWVLMPCVTCVFPIYYAWRGSFNLYLFCWKQSGNKTERSDGKGGRVIVPAEHRGEMLRSEYDHSITRNFRCSYFLDFLAALAAAADIYFMISAKQKIIYSREIAFFVMNLAILSISVIFTIQMRKIRQKIVKKVV